MAFTEVVPFFVTFLAGRVNIPKVSGARVAMVGNFIETLVPVELPP